MSPTPNLADIYVFKKIASTLSLTKAARTIGVSRSAVSKQLSRLERDLGVILVNRSTRSVSLTEAGRTFHARTGGVDTTIEQAADLVRGADHSPVGIVTLTLPTALGAALMPALIGQFQPNWPDVTLNVQFQDDTPEMISDGLDLAIQISGKLPDSSLISRRLETTRKVLAASPRYLRRHGTPEAPEDLRDHRCLGLDSTIRSSRKWTLEADGQTIILPMSFTFMANNELSLILAACLHSGIICVPEISIAGELARNQLQVISRFTAPTPLGIYALYPHKNTAAKVKAVVDFIDSVLKNVKSLGHWTPLAHLSAVDVNDGTLTECARCNSVVA